MSEPDLNSSPSPGDWKLPSAVELDRMLPQYEIVDILGRGGMGAVFKGRQASLKRDVAIKVLCKSAIESNAEVNPIERFKQEARVMAQFDHPAIISVYDFGETHDGQFYLVMEFVDGMDIHDYLQHHGGRLPQEHALSITAHVLDGLAYAHSHGIIHRDIKPANILLNQEGRVKIADFGLMKKFGAGNATSLGLGSTGFSIGTPYFLAPEAVDPNNVLDHRVDLYSVGVMLYQMLTGKLPQGSFKDPSALFPELDVRLDDIVQHAMEPDPDQRYASAAAIRADIDNIVSQPIAHVQAGAEGKDIPSAAPVFNLPPHGGPDRKLPQHVEKKSSKASLYAGVGLAVLLVVGTFVAMTKNKEKGDDSEDSIAQSPASVSSEQMPAKGEKAAAFPEESNAPAKPVEPESKPEPKLVQAEIKKVEPKVAEEKPAPAKADPPQKKAVKAGPPIGGAKQSELLAISELKPLLENYLGSRSRQINELSDKYLKALEGKLNQAADDGDLNLVKAFREEKKLVEALQKSLANPPANPVVAAAESATLPVLSGESPAGLKSLRKIWTGERQKIRDTLAKGMQQFLEKLEGKLTKARDFANAEKIQTYREIFTVEKTIPPPEPATATNTAMITASATRGKPFENSLGMRFVPVPIVGGPSSGKRVLFSIWETRVSDFETFTRRNKEHRREAPQWDQNDEHPVVRVNWDDEVAFCEWLTELERKKKKIGKGDVYRLPTDHEWSCAVGIGEMEDAEVDSEVKRNENNKYFPWGEGFPPTKSAGNYYGEECERNPAEYNNQPIKGFDDGFDRTAPVGSFEANHLGLYDMGGNVSEICKSRKDSQGIHVVRGGGWDSSNPESIQSSTRFLIESTKRRGSVGFRIVLERDAE